MGNFNLKERFWYWFVFNLIKYPEGKMLTLPLKIMFAILFPMKSIHYKIEDREGYQPMTNTWIIHGMKYSDVLFGHFAFGSDEIFKIIKREKDGLITIEKIVPK